jgi:hypothetical protein
MVAQKKIHFLVVMPERFGINFKMFPIVELTKLGGQNFKLGLYSEKYLALKMKGHLEPLH